MGHCDRGYVLDNGLVTVWEESGTRAMGRHVSGLGIIIQAEKLCENKLECETQRKQRICIALHEVAYRDRIDLILKEF